MVCLCVCVCVCVCVISWRDDLTKRLIYMSKYICMCLFVCLCLCVCVWYVYIYIYIYILYVCMYIYIYCIMYRSTNTYVHTYIHKYIYTYIYITYLQSPRHPHCCQTSQYLLKFERLRTTTKPDTKWSNSTIHTCQVHLKLRTVKCKKTGSSPWFGKWGATRQP